jgi:hypothetical protein
LMRGEEPEASDAIGLAAIMASERLEVNPQRRRIVLSDQWARWVSRDERDFRQARNGTFCARRRGSATGTRRSSAPRPRLATGDRG